MGVFQPCRRTSRPPPPLSAAPRAKELRDRAWWERRTDATVEDARWWLKTARALARTWSFVQLGKDPVSALDAESFVEIHEGDLWVQFTLALDAGLRPFRARAEFQRIYPQGYEHTFGAPLVGPYSAAWRQIFNLIVNDETARVCERDVRSDLRESGRWSHSREIPKHRPPVLFTEMRPSPNPEAVPQAQHRETEREQVMPEPADGTNSSRKRRRHGRRTFGAIEKLPSGRYRASYKAPDGKRRFGPTCFRPSRTPTLGSA